jgi:hypothetical protein
VNDPRKELSDVALAEKLFAEARDDGVAIHPAVGVRIRERIEDRLAQRGVGTKLGWRLAPIAATASIAAMAIAMLIWWAPATRSDRLLISDPHATRSDGLLISDPHTTRSDRLLSDPRAVRIDEPSPQLAPASRSDGAKVESLVRAREQAVTLELAPGKQVEVRPFGALAMDPPEVLDGEVEFRVATLPPGETFRVRAAGVTAEVIGTIFTVRRAGDRVDVGVQGGEVRVTHDGSERVLRAGERWSTEDHREHAASRASRILEASYQRAKRTKPSLDPRERTSPEEQAQRTLLERAAEHLKQGDLESARAIYRELAEGEDSGAALGLYLLARLEARHAGRPAAALEALDRFSARFSEHALAAEASAEPHRGLPRPEALRRSASRVATVPRSPRRRERSDRRLEDTSSIRLRTRR